MKQNKIEKSKTQLAMEFLMTYCWAILVVLILLSSLYYFNVFSPRCPPNFQISGGIFSIIDQKFIGSNAELIQNFFYVVIKNNLPYSIKVEEITINKGDLNCGSFVFPQGFYLEKGQTSNIIQEELINENCYGKIKSCYKFDTNIKYTNPSTGFTRTQTGEITGSFENMNDYWQISSWSTSDYSGSIVENRNGEYLNICNPESVPNPLTLTGSLPQGIITWDLPNGCNTQGLAQVSFDNACNNQAQYLSKGWMHNTLYVDLIFSNNRLYLGGNAEYYDEIAGETKTNGICINDNLYFYVNNELKYYGGTTGIMVGEANTYEQGDEVLKNCGNCQNVDASAWCIPAFELTTEGFNFGEDNSIDILIEDFCKGQGQQHAGGMSALSLKMI